jgi:hypothetical protein
MILMILMGFFTGFGLVVAQFSVLVAQFLVAQFLVVPVTFVARLPSQTLISSLFHKKAVLICCAGLCRASSTVPGRCCEGTSELSYGLCYVSSAMHSSAMHFSAVLCLMLQSASVRLGTADAAVILDCAEAQAVLRLCELNWS